MTPTPITLCSLGVTEQMLLSPGALAEHVDRLGGSPVAEHLEAITRFYFEFHEEVGEGYQAQIHDLLTVLRAEWRRMAEDGPTAAEMEEAIAFMTGSQPLQFTDSRRIAATLLAMRRNGRPLDWLARRPERLATISRDHAAKLAGRLLQPGALSVTVAGQPEGL